jgi:excisionase family DNA binding protein
MRKVDDSNLPHNPDETREPLLTTAEVAAWLRIGPATISLMARTGRIPSLRIGKEYRFRRAEIDQAMREAGRPRKGAPA